MCLTGEAMHSHDSHLHQQLSQQPQPHQQTSAFVFNFNDNARMDGRPTSSAAAGVMTGMESPAHTEISAAPADAWTTPTSQVSRPRPATIYEGFTFCAGDEFLASMPSWDTASNMTMHTPSDTMSRPVSMHQNFYPGLAVGNDAWGSKSCDESMEMHHLDSDMNIGQAFTTDEAIPILDLRYSNSQVENETLTYEPSMQPRRMSGSSFTMSTTGLSDMPSYEDYSGALSEAPSFTSEYPPTSNRNSLMSSTQLSPVASPRMTPQSRSELVRAQSRGRGASPSPRPIVRSAPYCVDNSARNKRWSTGSYGTNANRRPSPFVYHHSHDAFGGRLPSRHASPTVSNNPMPLNFGNLQAMQYPYLASHPATQTTAFQHGMVLPSQMPPHLPSNGFHPEPQHFEAPPHPQLMSHGLFRMLQSNADPHSLHGHYADLADPPDLYSSLQEEQIPPPPEDMNPSDPDLIPHEQDLRFEGDLYTPRWVRGHGNKREGWCGICKPGRWLVLKNSAFWYDKSFTHGISAATGSPFQEPQETRRMDGSPDVWEGLCGSCNDWIALVSSKKKGTTWFRHAYKCHTHPKIKDVPKKRRESSHSKSVSGSQITKPRIEQQRPETPQHTLGSMSMATTPTPATSYPLIQHSTMGHDPRVSSQKFFLVPDANNMI